MKKPVLFGRINGHGIKLQNDDFWVCLVIVVYGPSRTRLVRFVCPSTVSGSVIQAPCQIVLADADKAALTLIVAPIAERVADRIEIGIETVRLWHEAQDLSPFVAHELGNALPGDQGGLRHD